MCLSLAELSKAQNLIEKVEVLIPEQFLVAFLLSIFLLTALYLFCGD